MRQALVLAVVLMVLAPAPPPAAASTTWHTYANAAGSRRYLLEIPPRRHRHPALVVYLHGCGQSAADVAGSIGWSPLATRRGFAVVYPEEPNLGCWDWLQRKDQHRGAGEPSILAGITREVMHRLRADRDRVYIVGASAGAYMAEILAVGYPDLYASLGILAGGPYGLGLNSVPDLTGRAIVHEMGPRARPVPVFVFQGTLDNVNPFAAGALAVQQWLGVYDLLDDGRLDGSFSRRPTSEETQTATGRPDPSHPATCDQPCLGGLLGIERYPYTVADYGSRLRFVAVHGANHDYTGASGGSYTDPTGPDLTGLAWSFFFRHTLRGG